MEGGKLKKEIIGLSEKATTNKGEKSALRELFGETKDPRFTLLSAMTNLSTTARTAAYLTDIATKNAQVQKAGGRGFMWASEDAAKIAFSSSGVLAAAMSKAIDSLN